MYFAWLYVRQTTLTTGFSTPSCQVDIISASDGSLISLKSLRLNSFMTTSLAYFIGCPRAPTRLGQGHCVVGDVVRSRAGSGFRERSDTPGDPTFPAAR